MGAGKMNTIKSLRASRGLTQQALADKAGIHINQIQKLEYKECAPENLRLKTAIAIADALCVDVKELLK